MFQYYYLIPLIQILCTVKRFQVLLFNTNNPIQHFSLVYTHLYSTEYCHVTQTIQFKISYLFAYS